MGVRWRTTTNDFPRVQASVRQINGKKVSVGVLGGGENTWLASVHEYGCTIPVTDKMRKYLAANGLHLKKTTTQIVIPERAFLRNGFDENKDEVLRSSENALGAVMSGAMTGDQFLELVGLMLKGKIQNYARDLSSPPNHPFTVSRKGSSNPLISSGDLVGSITYKVE